MTASISISGLSEAYRRQATTSQVGASQTVPQGNEFPALDAIFGPGGGAQQAEIARRRFGGLGEALPFSDEVGAAVGVASDLLRGVVTGADIPSVNALFNERREIERGAKNQFRDENPLGSFVADLAGATAIQPANALTAAPGFIGRGVNAIFGFNPSASAGRRAMQAVRAGAAGGAIAGFDEGEGGASERLESAGEGALVGGTLGVAAGGVLNILGNIGGRVVRGLRFATGLSDDQARLRADQLLREALEADGIDVQMAAQRAANGVPLTIADLGPNTQRLVDAANRLGGEGRRELGDFLTERTAGRLDPQTGRRSGGQFDRISDQLATAVGIRPEDFTATTDALAARRVAQAAPLYRQLESQTTVVDDELAELLERPSVRAALRRAATSQRNLGEKVPSAFEEGDVISFRLLNAAKKELDDDARFRETLVGGARKNSVGAIRSANRQLVSALDARFPGFAQARKSAAEVFELEDALQEGRRFINEDSFELRRALRNMSGPERAMFRLGAARAVQARIGQRGDTQDASLIFQNQNMQDRLRTVFGDEAAMNRFMRAVQDENTAQRTRNAVLGGSQTADRLQAGEDLANGPIARFASDAAGNGRVSIGTLATATANLVADQGQRVARGVNEQVSDNIARRATDTNVADVVRSVRAANPDPNAVLPAPVQALQRGVSTATGRDRPAVQGFVAGTAATREEPQSAPLGGDSPMRGNTIRLPGLSRALRQSQEGSVTGGTGQTGGSAGGDALRGSRFDDAFDRVLEFEGGFNDDPRDPGGRTNLGVIQSTYDAYRRKLGMPLKDVADITMDEVRDIYRTEFWEPIRAGDMPPGVGFAVFDFAINSGPGNAVMTLQRVLGVGVDGVVGPETLGAVASADPQTLIRDLANARMDFLEQTEAFEQFPSGMRNRVNKARRAALAVQRDMA